MKLFAWVYADPNTRLQVNETNNCIPHLSSLIKPHIPNQKSKAQRHIQFAAFSFIQNT